ncbi:MAG: putative selenate reductase subunit YgfK [Firmicutes bacterium HGW-Firmicutes-9]|nr:MAG: putative selenate reductase subunit YgfK [Firmicutes bacterium HGW-Firmicutes-9]
MSDRMTPIPFAELMNWILEERKQGSVFGIRRPYVAPKGKLLDLFSEHLETPFGPAAGPQTQLSQNLIAAYYAGSRFFELKTVQTLDGEDLPVSKPCILAEDECYNVEWSTELRVPEAYDEYVKAWYALKLMSWEFDLGRPDGFMFNMSVGYNFEGITSEKIDSFIEGLKNASSTPIWQECRAWAKENLSRFSKVDAKYIDAISPNVCSSITLSTLHGCPPQEIERIASYLITKKGLNTFVKCNPTLLGYQFARKTMDDMGYDYLVFDDFHFNDDLQYRDAVPMFKRLLDLACENGVQFGLKLTNTFPVGIARDELPGNEMYMSGRSLYPLTIELAHRISREFDGRMRLSFSGGADFYNITELFDAGIWPITIATTLLKPGGYQRCKQIAEKLVKEDYVPFDGVSVGKVAYLARAARTDERHVKPVKPLPVRKIKSKVPLTNCFIAPCEHGCPINQDIPEYVRLVGDKKYGEALKLILERNPLPFITGRICSHRCMDKCTRGFYEESVHIRDAKLLAAREGFDSIIGTLKPTCKSDADVAVIGGGPAGMAMGYLLGRQGAKVTVFEKRAELGGIVRYVIPGFRIGDYGMDRDVDLLKAMGAEIKTNTTAPSVAELKKLGYTHVVFATGAWAHGELRLTEGKSMNVLDFLEQYKCESLQDVGQHVVIVGGGNTAMDAARAAKRIKGVESASIVYRRTQRYMPADEEELQLALEDGVEFKELLNPVALKDGKLVCKKCVLGKPDASGRLSSVETDELVEIPCSLLVSAIGEKVVTSDFSDNGIQLTERGAVKVNPETLETSEKNVFVIGDANRGPATVVEAIADARKVADVIVGKYEVTVPEESKACSGNCLAKQGSLAVYDSAGRETERCLACSTICECCVQVCPNRANIAIEVEGMEMPQIIHVDRMCNECGNCTAFCPYDSAPYKEKFTFFSTEKEFDESENKGFFVLGGSKVKLRLDEVSTVKLGTNAIDPDIEKIINAVIWDYSYLF